VPILVLKVRIGIKFGMIEGVPEVVPGELRLHRSGDFEDFLLLEPDHLLEEAVNFLL